MTKNEIRAKIEALTAELNRTPKAGEVWINRKYTKDNLRLIVAAADGSLFAVSPETGKYKGKGVTFGEYEFYAEGVCVCGDDEDYDLV